MAVFLFRIPVASVSDVSCRGVLRLLNFMRARNGLFFKISVNKPSVFSFTDLQTRLSLMSTWKDSKSAFARGVFEILGLSSNRQKFADNPPARGTHHDCRDRKATILTWTIEVTETSQTATSSILIEIEKTKSQKSHCGS